MVPFSQLPGRHERHLRRKLNNPLMGGCATSLMDDDLLAAQRLDHEELLVFLPQLREAVRQAVDLKPTEESQIVLDLKANLEQLYETCCSLADAHSGNQLALRQLISVIMASIRKNAQGDALAMQELDQEESARAHHFHLLQFPLVADLMHPRSVILQDELVPVLLGDDETQVRAALTLFDADQLRIISDQAHQLLQERNLLESYSERLALLRKTS